MDDTDTNQAASTSSSPEDILRQFDYLSDVSPAFFPGLGVRRTPPVSPEEEEETKRESPRSETKTPIRQLRFATPIQEDPPSPKYWFGTCFTVSTSSSTFYEHLHWVLDVTACSNH